MPRQQVRGRRFLLVGVLGLALVSWLLASQGLGQPPVADTSDEIKTTAKQKLFFGTTGCNRAGCHGNEKPLENKASPPLCRGIEAKIWETNDKHKNAYLALQSPRSQRMGELLGKDVKKAETGCLGCHSMVLAGAPTHPSFKVEDGISCAICHGTYGDWVSAHYDALLGQSSEEWRKLARKEKEAKFGMVDLWDPAQRTRVCVSCHIGNATQGKVVTHEMYAAGHPPLPSIEMGIFSDEMPRHWQYVKEKSPEVQKLLGYANADETRFEPTKLVVISGAAALRGAMNLLAGDAERAGQSQGAIDFAQLDCFACHHDLKVPSVIQERGYPGRPGRPSFRKWPVALARLGAQYAGRPEAELPGKLQPVYEAFDARPFGDPAKVGPAARAVAAWADQLVTDLGKAPYNDAVALSLLKKLCELATKELPDYDTARQISWAFKIIYRDWDEKNAKAPKVAELLGALGKELKLDLPSGQKREILAELSDTLEKRNAFDAKSFQKRFLEIEQALPRS